MSTIIVITVPTKPPQLNQDAGELEETVIKVKLEGEGSISDLLREAADVIDGTG